MPKVRITMAALRDPLDSTETFVKIIPAQGCGGDECGGPLGCDENGEIVWAAPHCHLVLSGESPTAAGNGRYVGVDPSFLPSDLA